MSNLDTAKAILGTKNTCVLVQNQQIYISQKTGIAPLMEYISNNIDLKGFSLADKIVGKAVAFLVLRAGIKEVYAQVISQPALDLLRKNKVKVHFDTLTENIINRAGTGLCPMEQTVKDETDPELAYQKLKEKLRSMQMKKLSDEHGGIFGIGNPNDAYAKYFIGKSYLKPLTNSGDPLFVANVTFEPGCRNNWHVHHSTKGGGQVLICVEGKGWYQEWGKPARALAAGDVVSIPANVKHWHGAAKDSWFSHLAIEVPGENTSNEWLEPVADSEYDKL